MKMKIDGTEIKISLGAFQEARAAGRRAARNKVHYDQNPHGTLDADRRWAWSKGHNEQRAANLNGRKYA
jgi:hypothetical protein